MTKAGSTGFWVWGQQTHITALNKEEKEKLTPLVEKLKSEHDQEKKALLKAEIETIKKEFKAKRKGAESSLFAGS
jgi:hypothetical protein